MSVIVSAIFRLRGDIAGNWESINPVLDVREPAIETNTRRLKIGDGVKAWNDLPYATIEAKRIFELIATLSPAADKGIYFVDDHTAALFDITAFGRSIAATEDAAGLLGLLGLGTLDDQLASIEARLDALESA